MSAVNTATSRTTPATADASAGRRARGEQPFVTLTLDGQLCGISVATVRDVLGEQAITRIPLAPAEIAGSLNLRGRIVTAIDLRRRLRLTDAPPGSERMSVVCEQAGELYALLVDEVSEVALLDASSFEPCPPTLPPDWTAFAIGVCRVGGRLMVALDVARLLAVGAERGARFAA